MKSMQMGRSLNHIFSVCIFFCFQVNAQDTATVVLDTTVISESDSLVNSQNEKKYYFNEVSDTQTIDERKIDDSIVNRIKADDAYWYVNEAPKKKETKTNQEQKGVLQQQWFKTIFWVLLIGGFVALLVWFLASVNIRLFRKSSKIIDHGDSNKPPAENIFELNYDQEVSSAITAKNYRLAVRLLYLRTLKELSDRQLIQYTNEKTNSDYLFQLSGTAYYKSFFRLTRNFEYTWYGKFELSQDSFVLMQHDFSSFKKQLA